MVASALNQKVPLVSVWMKCRQRVSPGSNTSGAPHKAGSNQNTSLSNLLMIVSSGEVYADFSSLGCVNLLAIWAVEEKLRKFSDSVAQVKM